MKLLLWLVIICLPLQAIAERPIIGVAGSGPVSNSVRYSMAALWDAGAYPILLDTRRPSALASHLAVLNGVVIAGNSLDINPADYTSGAVHPKTSNEDVVAKTEWDKARDDYEYVLIEAVVEREIPFLGICSGAQRLNVALGGTLAQHIDGQLIWGEGPHLPVTPIKVMPATKLSALLPSKRFIDNTIHHQHIDRLADGFRVAARDVTSGIVEAIEPVSGGAYARHPFLKAVQWHPEYVASDESRALVRHFVNVAREHATQNPVSPQKAQHIDASSPMLRQMIERGVEGMRERYGYKTPEGLPLR